MQLGARRCDQICNHKPEGFAVPPATLLQDASWNIDVVTGSEIPLHPVNPDGQAVFQREVLRMLRED